MRLRNQVALITGAARGQGAAQAVLFAREGAKVVVADILTDQGRKTGQRSAIAEATLASGSVPVAREPPNDVGEGLPSRIGNPDPGPLQADASI